MIILFKNTRFGCRCGFTLLELIIVVTIFGVAAAIAVPALNSVTKNSDLRAAAQELYGNFQLAKSEAIKRNQPVAIVFDAVNHGKWYRVFVDSDEDHVLDAGEDELAEINLPNSIEFSPAVNFDGNNLAGFTPQGRPLDGDGTAVLVNTVTGDSLTLTNSISGYVHLQ